MNKNIINKYRNLFFEADAGGGSGGGGPAPASGAPAPGQQQQQPAPGAGITQQPTPDANAPKYFLDLVTDEGLRKDPSLAPLAGKDATEAAKMLVNAQKLIGKQRMEAPNDKWTDLEWNGFYQKAGRPETPEAYKLEKPELPEGLPYDEKMDKHFASLAHKAGLNQKQLEIMRGGYTEFVAGAFTSNAEARASQSEAWEGEVRKEFGKEFDVKINTARHAVRNIGGDELAQVLDQYGLSDHPVLVRTFAKIGAELQEDQATNGSSNTGLAASPERATIEIAELRANTDFMKDYNDPSRPGHKLAVEKLSNLYKVKNKNK